MAKDSCLPRDLLFIRVPPSVDLPKLLAKLVAIPAPPSVAPMLKGVILSSFLPGLKCGSLFGDAVPPTAVLFKLMVRLSR